MMESKRHLDKTSQGYIEHLFFAFKWGCYLILTGLISIIHGLFPGILQFTAPRNVMKVARMIEKRGKPEELSPLEH